MNQTKPTLIFDMDGVILDTEQLVRRCWNEIAPEFHADAIDAVFLTTVGTTRVHTCSILRERTRLFSSHITLRSTPTRS